MESGKKLEGIRQFFIKGQGVTNGCVGVNVSVYLGQFELSKLFLLDH